MIISRRVKFAGHVVRSGVRRPEGRRPLRRPGLEWKDNIKIDIREVG